MEVKVITEKITVLTMNEKETKWLKAILQNPLCDNELPEDSNMRASFWEGLNNGNT